MPFRLTPDRTKMQFLTSARMPSRVYKACVKTGIPSNTRYVQLAVCEALHRDLGIPMEELVGELPPTRQAGEEMFGGDRIRKAVRTGAANTVEEVR